MRAIRRLVLCLVPFACIACGPVGIGAGVASLFNDDGTGIDLSVKPNIEVEAPEDNEKTLPSGDKVTFRGPGLELELEIKLDGGDFDDLKQIFVRRTTTKDLTPDTVADEQIDPGEVRDLIYDRDADQSLRVGDVLMYKPPTPLIDRENGAEDGDYHVRVVAVDKFGRVGESETLTWRWDSMKPTGPKPTMVVPNEDGTQLKEVKWELADPTEVDEIESYDILFVRDEDFDAEEPEPDPSLPPPNDYDLKDLFDPVPDPALPVMNQGTDAEHIQRKEIEAKGNTTTTPGQTTTVTITANNVGVRMDQRICRGMHIAIVAIDFANNRSEIDVIGSPQFDGCRPPQAEMPTTPRLTANADSALAPLTAGTSSGTTHHVDVNGDGCPDLVYIADDGPADDRVRIRFAECGEDGKGTGNYGNEIIRVIAPDIDPITAFEGIDLGRRGEVDGNGGGEYVLGLSKDRKRFGLLRRVSDKYQREGRFAELPGEIRNDYSPREFLTVRDINGDGYDDVLVIAEHDAGTDEDVLVVYLGVGENGAGGTDLSDYSPVVTRMGLRARETISGHFNGDTLRDTAACDGKVVRLLLGAATLARPHVSNGRHDLKRIVVPDPSDLPPPVQAGGPEFLAKADLDRNGIEDIVTSNAGGSISVIRGVADSNFGVPENHSAIPPGSTIAQTVSLGAGPILVADLDLDRILDVFVAGVAGNSVSLLHGNGSNGVWDGTFAPAVALPVPFDPAVMSAGDTDGDGLLDITVFDATGKLVHVLEGSGFLPRSLRTFTAGPVLPLPLHPAHQLALLDLDGDSILDVVAAGGRTGAGIQTLFLGNGANGVADGNFGLGFTRGIGDGEIQSLVTGDFNRDATPDLAAASATGVDVQFGGFSTDDQRFRFASDMLYKFRPTEADDPDRIAQTIVGDFNHDGILDLISRGAAALHVQLGQNDKGTTDGSFVFSWDTPAAFLDAADTLACGGIGNGPGPGNPFADLLAKLGTGLRIPLAGVTTPGNMGSADFDGDGGLDVVVVEEATRQLAVLRNYGRDCGDGAGIDLPGFGMFEAPVLYPSFGTLPFMPGPMVVVDLNGDDVPDVAALAKDPGLSNETFCVLLGKRDDFVAGAPPGLTKFRFLAATRGGAGGDPSAIASADLDQDGNVDILVTDKTAGSITVFFGDGTGDYSSAPTTTISLAVTTPRSISIGDLNGDFLLDIVVGGDAGAQVIYADAGNR